MTRVAKNFFVKIFWLVVTFRRSAHIFFAKENMLLVVTIVAFRAIATTEL